LYIRGVLGAVLLLLSLHATALIANTPSVHRRKLLSLMVIKCMSPR
jgi:hypothetical protein